MGGRPKPTGGREAAREAEAADRPSLPPGILELGGVVAEQDFTCRPVVADVPGEAVPAMVADRS